MAVYVIDTLKPKNNGSFPIIDDVDVNITSKNKKLSEVIATIDSASNYVTPEMFGAVGDGITDDKNAFDALANSGCNLIILKSNTTYAISGFIMFNSSVRIIGSNSTIYVTAKRSDAMRFYAKADVSGVVFKGTGEGFAGSENEGAGRLVYIDGAANNTTIQNCVFKDGNYVGLQAIDYPENVNIQSCMFDNCWAEGISFLANNSTISDCVFKNCKYNGVVLRGCQNVVVRNNKFINIDGTDNALDMLQSYDGTKSCTHIIIDGNIFKNCNRSLSVYGTTEVPHEDITVINNQFEIKDVIDYVIRNYFSNNLFYNNNHFNYPQTITTVLFSSCKNIEFTGNSFSGECERCVDFSADNVICCNNVFSDATSYAVRYRTFLTTITSKLIIANNRFDACEYGIEGGGNYNFIVSITSNVFDNASNPTIKLEGGLPYAVVNDNIFTVGSWSDDLFIDYNQSGTFYCQIEGNNIDRKDCTSSTRPKHPQIGRTIYDSSVSSLIVWDGTNWAKTDGTIV